MSFVADLKILYHLLLKPARGRTHADRLEGFYAGQAEAYDAFRERLLPGRRELWASLSPPVDGVWIDMGGGTAANLELLGDRIHQLKKVYVVDLCPSLLGMARRRIERNGWDNVEAVEADATTFQPPVGPADIVTFSYSLTMIPDWFAAIENALTILRPGGMVGVVDFYVSRKHPGEGLASHSWATRSFWPLWFGADNVFPSPDHVPFLRRRFEPVSLVESRARIPYLPFLKAPYYTFVGRKRAA